MSWEAQRPADGPRDGVSMLLHREARRGNAVQVAALLAVGAAVYATDANGWTPLHEAALGGHEAVAAALLAAGVPVDAVSNRGITPLHAAAQRGRAAAAAVLVAAGAPVDAAINYGFTPLHMAAYHGHEAVAAALLAAGAPVDAVSNEGFMPLHAAAQRGRAAAAAVLVASGAPVDAASFYDFTPLHSAALGGYAAVVATLLAAGSPVDAVSKNGCTSLNIAAKAGHTGAVAAMLTAGASMDMEDVNGKSRLFYLSADAPWGPVVALATPVDRAFAALQAALDTFAAHPEMLTEVAAFKWLLVPTRFLDVRCLRCAHQLLLLSVRLGLQLRPPPGGDTVASGHGWFERVYQPVLGHLEPHYKRLVATIVMDAVKHGILDPFHVPIMSTALCLHATFLDELAHIRKILVHVNHRVHRLETAAKSTGQLLFSTMTGVRDLQLYIQDKEKRERRVALVKSLVKIGLSLAPLVGGALSSAADAVEVRANSAAGAAVVYQHMVDPSDLAAARRVLQRIHDVKDTLTPTQQRSLKKCLHLYDSIEQVDRELAWAARALQAPEAATTSDGAAVSADGVEGGRSDCGEETTAGGGAAVEAAAPDDLDKPQEVVVDALVDEGVDRAAGRTRRDPLSPSADGDGAVTASFGVAFFADALDWDPPTVAAKLVAYVARPYTPPRRDAFAAAVGAAAAHHEIDGATVCAGGAGVDESVACLLGPDWQTRQGAVVATRQFFAAARRHSEGADGGPAAAGRVWPGGVLPRRVATAWVRVSDRWRASGANEYALGLAVVVTVKLAVLVAKVVAVVLGAATAVVVVAVLWGGIDT